MFRRLGISATLLLIVVSTASAFVVGPSSSRAVRSKPLTRVNLEDWVADLIDRELYRETHKKEFEQEWMEKNRGAMLYHMSPPELSSSSFVQPDQEDFREHQRDKRLAKTDPQRYCADRCVATGNCDVYEDIFDFTPQQVLQFCTDCVLATDEAAGSGECEIPDAFWDLDDSKLLP